MTEDTSYKEYKYISLGPGDPIFGPKLAEFIIEQISELKGIQRICDLGCGNGYLANRLAGLGFSVLGIDASESGIEMAKRYERTELKFLCSTFNSSLYKIVANQDYELVASVDVIEHLYSPTELLHTAHQLLKPGGFLILSTPYHGYLKNLALSLLDKWDSHHGVEWDGGHIKFFSVNTLKQLVEKNGFVVNKFLFLGRMPWLWKSMICLAQKPV